MVHVELLGGSVKTYTTKDFLAATPEMISGNYRMCSVFGVDYRHREAVTSEIPLPQLTLHRAGG